MQTPQLQFAQQASTADLFQRYIQLYDTFQALHIQQYRTQEGPGGSLDLQCPRYDAAAAAVAAAASVRVANHTAAFGGSDFVQPLRPLLQLRPVRPPFRPQLQQRQQQLYQHPPLQPRPIVHSSRPQQQQQQQQQQQHV
jgi:hypothetical protein